MDLVASVEARRSQLELNLAKLETSLRHWRTWDAEYEGLKEELQDLDESAQSEEIVNVMQNISTISKQVQSLQDEIEASDASIQSDPIQPESSFPVAEIIEQLDDDDNVISSKIEHPEHSTAKIVEALRQVGVKGVGEKAEQVLSAQRPSVSAQVVDSAHSDFANTGPNSDVERTTSANSQPLEQPQSMRHDRQGTGTATLDSTSTENSRNMLSTTSVNHAPINGSRELSESLINGSFNPGDRVFEIDDEDEILASGAILPQDESPEDAQLRREMLQYHLNEVGNVVAEIDLLEGDSDDDFTDELEDLDDVSVNSDLSEEEDEHGRSKRAAMTEAYRREMKDLEKRLNSPMMTNLGPDFGIDDAQRIADAASTEERRSKEIQQKPKPSTARTNAPKTVRFAEELDVSPVPERAQPSVSSSVKGREDVLAGSVLERTTSESTPSIGSITAPGKVSRFKASRSAASATAPQQQDPQTSDNRPVLSADVPERQSIGPSPVAPSEEDQFDPELQRRQLAARYYELRNDMIRKQGGFKAPEDEEDDGEGPLMEETADGRVKKVSRFKAARMKH
ncbi:hypothetical protein ANO11243_023370 [Dothideomycetidae sp. 11243]|nr:hypothetical protein ANO11243_023370 [fungal sp. No.11243]